jgi:branched-chain amino acid transport system substrate-binding protein
MKVKLLGAAVVTAALMVGMTCMSTTGASAASTPGVTSSTITIGFIGNLTGIASSTFFDSVGGIQARIALQNANGGVDGRKLKMIVKNDQSSPTTDESVAQELVNDGVFGVVGDSSFLFSAAKTLQAAGTPVTGAAFDGPEWGQKPYTNMFSYYPVVETPFNGRVYNYDYWGTFMKSVGVTKVAGLSYGISPSAKAAIATTLASANKHGISTCYADNAVPFGGVDFTADALAMKSANCNGVAMAMVDSSDVAVGQALKNGGVKAKPFLSGTGYDQSIASSASSMKALDGGYADALVNFTNPNSATQAMLTTLKKYDPQYHGGVPDYGTTVAYLATDLMIKGMQATGKNLTQAGFMSAMYNKVKTYNAGGALPGANTFSLKAFGTVDMLPKTYCTYWIGIQDGKYVTSNGGKPGCGGQVSAPNP